jgi:hypothetical protein
MNIKGLPHLDEILIQGIVFCAVLESDLDAGPHHDCVDFAKFTMRHKGIEIDKMRDFTSMESKHVWYEYFVLESFELNGDSLQVRLSTDFMSKKKGFCKLFIRSFGVHIIHKHEENANDHPDMTHVESCFSFEGNGRYSEISSTQDESDEESENSVGSIKEDEESENLECLTKRNKIERIQPSKSRCDDGSDDGDYNLESSCFSVRNPYLTLMLVFIYLFFLFLNTLMLVNFVIG